MSSGTKGSAGAPLNQRAAEVAFSTASAAGRALRQARALVSQGAELVGLAPLGQGAEHSDAAPSPPATRVRTQQSSLKSRSEHLNRKAAAALSPTNEPPEKRATAPKAPAKKASVKKGPAKTATATKAPAKNAAKKAAAEIGCGQEGPGEESLCQEGSGEDSDRHEGSGEERRQKGGCQIGCGQEGPGEIGCHQATTGPGDTGEKSRRQTNGKE